MVPSDADTAKSMYPPLLGNSFSFKFEDQKGRVHRFNSGTESLDELESAVKQRVGLEDSKEKIHLLYVDDEGDKVLLATDSDLAGAVNHAKLAGWKVLRLHIDNSDTKQSTTKLEEATKISSDLAVVEKSQLTPLTTGLMAGAVVLTGMGIMVYLKRANV
ncbi:uncharacterized protein A4U43_C09F9850 [Asparagus officinalis]|uniref:PB1 domain-containing protein n=2 Tax=Asparagus officinalis TaxID=4686 RepID=A0A5P1EBC9_ASPOF|nr:uncharacterized protein A4U43_C09F9850 [Asparagus officinalis]